MKKTKQYNPIKIGEKLGNLTVLSLTDKKTKHGKRIFLCECSCGTFKEISANLLRKGDTISCGCVHKKYLENMKKPPGFITWNFLFNNYRANALRKNIKFMLTFSEYVKIASLDCYYCGSPPILYNYYLKNDGTKKYRKCTHRYTQETIDRGQIQKNGIDRLDNEKGYIVENCLPCCKTCNAMKSDSLKESFIEHIKKIYLNIGEKKNGCK